MKTKLKAPVAALVLAWVCIVTGGDALAQKLTVPATGGHVLTDRKVRLTGDNNVVRSGPGNSFAIVGVFHHGDEFLVIAKRGEWYNVRLSDTETGWVHASLCKEFDDLSDLEFRPNPRMFARIGSFALTAFSGGYTFDRKSNSFVFGGRLGYNVLDFLEVEGGLGFTHIVRPAEIVESLFGLALEEENFYMLYYAMNANFKILPGRQMVPFVTTGVGSSIMQGETETSFNYGVGTNFYFMRQTAFRFEFRTYRFNSGSSSARRTNTNFEFSVGTTYLF